MLTGLFGRTLSPLPVVLGDRLHQGGYDPVGGAALILHGHALDREPKVLGDPQLQAMIARFLALRGHEPKHRNEVRQKFFFAYQQMQRKC
jgi:hypothetical protein